ncbi:hypothetical protein IM538_06725 [Cytobacillus suaedae]|nr:hypothetical protein IM538_06725 [Cytobacillus suaedae]
MKKKKWIVGCVTVIALLTFLNLNTIYIVVEQPMVFPYPPSQAKKNDDVVFYEDIPKVNSKFIHQFVESFNNKQKANLTLTFYEEEPGLFSTYFITTPIKKYLLDYSGENHIILTDVSSDMITRMEYQDIKIVNMNSLQIYRLIDEINDDHFDIVIIPSSQ